ncbi:MAG: hypothetical protein IJ475_02005 [Bacilli bacterium]|nr:hypothetical protein [Bacilli bacterium]
MGRKKKNEISTEVNEIQENIDVTKVSKEVALDAVEIVSKEAKKEIRKEKGKRFFGEVRAFFLIVLIVGGIVLFTWYWYKNIYEPNKNVQTNEVIDENTKFELVSLKAEDDFFVLEDTYVIFYEREEVNKVTDIRGNVLFEGEVIGDSYYLDKDNNLYVVSYESGDYSNKAIVNKLVDGKFEELITLGRDNVFYSAVLYNDRLIGFTGYNTNTDNYFDEADNNDVYYALGKEEVEIGEYHLIGDEILITIDQDVYTHSNDYIVISKIINSKEKYGLYDLNENKIVIEAEYDDLIAVSNDAFIAVKDGMSGVIDSKSKKIVDFLYDFIAPFDGHFVVSKNDKMALMNANYEFITKFEFEYEESDFKVDYDYRNNYFTFNTVSSYKIGDKYVLNNHNMALDYDYEYYDENIYVINSDGSYDTVEAEAFVYSDDLIYSYLDGVYTFYNDDMSEKYSIDMNEYDKYKESVLDYGVVELFNRNTLILINDYYFNYEDGNEVDSILEWKHEVGNVVVNYDVESESYIVYIDGDSGTKVDAVVIDMLEDGTFYFRTKDEYVTIKRSE